MKELVAAFADHLEEGVTIAENANMEKSQKRIDNVLVLGMGGSGIGGTIASQVLSDELKVPVISYKDYSAPAFVSENTLVIVSSYSGNTEETLTALQKVSSKTSSICCVCSGGKLMELAKEQGYNCIVIPSGMPPRAAFGFSFPQLFRIFESQGLLSGNKRTAIGNAIDLIRKNEARMREEAEKIAGILKDKLPIIYAESGYEGVAVRFRQQINENAKKLCWHHAIPEMNHNELVGWREEASDKVVVMLRNESDFPRNQKRMELSKETFAKYNAEIIEIHSKGSSKLERSLYLIHLCDWVSVLIAEMNNMDPVEIEVINHFKGELAKDN